MLDHLAMAEDGAQSRNCLVPVTAVLVHGTFARGAPWTRPSTSGLCQQIRERLGERTSFDAFEWSGENRHIARLDAAAALAAHLEDLVAARPLQRVFVVGHSHGGTVIMHALRKSPHLVQHLAGVVFLSTPFIQIRNRPHAKALGSMLTLALVFSLLYLVVAFEDLLLALGWPAVIARVVSFVNLAVLVLGASALLLRTKALAEGANSKEEVVTILGQAIDRLREEFSAAKLDQTRTLFVRANADEASAALAWVQAISRLIGDVVGLALKLIAVMVPWGSKTHVPTGLAFRIARALGLALAAYVIVAVGVALPIAALDLVNTPLSWLGFDVVSTLKQWAPAMALANGLSTANAAVIEALSAAISLMVVAVAVMLAVTGALLALFNRAFGHWFVWTALFVEVSVEATPPGRWTLHQTQFSCFLRWAVEGTLRR